MSTRFERGANTRENTCPPGVLFLRGILCIGPSCRTLGRWAFLHDTGAAVDSHRSLNSVEVGKAERGCVESK